MIKLWRFMPTWTQTWTWAKEAWSQLVFPFGYFSGRISLFSHFFLKRILRWIGFILLMQLPIDFLSTIIPYLMNCSQLFFPWNSLTNFFRNIFENRRFSRNRHMFWYFWDSFRLIQPRIGNPIDNIVFLNDQPLLFNYFVSIFQLLAQKIKNIVF